MSNGRTYKSAMAILFILCAFLLYFLFCMFYPYDPMSGDEIIVPVVNENKTVIQGGNLILHLHQVKNIDAPTTVTSSFIDGFVYPIESRVSQKPKGIIDENTIVKVPDNLPPGKYRYESTVIFQVNPFRTVKETWQSEQFTVTASCK